MREQKVVLYSESGNPRSQGILEEMNVLMASSSRINDVRNLRVVLAPSPQDLNGDIGVALVDVDTNQFTLRHWEYGGKPPAPEWASEAKYLVYVGLGSLGRHGRRETADTDFLKSRAEGCARLLIADFGRHFQNRLAAGQLPWGPRRQFRISVFRLRPARNHRQNEAGCSHSAFMGQ